jgi:hypothetical protein
MVEAPVRGALAGVMGRGVALVAAMVLLALWPLVAKPGVDVCNAIAGLSLAVLVGYATWIRLSQRLHGRPSEEDRARAWERAKEIDRDDAMLSLIIVGWVPVGLFLALALLLWPRMTDADPAAAATWVVMALPPFTLAWLFATESWLEACRDDLARAEHEADVQLRRYWANVGH